MRLVCTSHLLIFKLTVYFPLKHQVDSEGFDYLLTAIYVSSLTSNTHLGKVDLLQTLLCLIGYLDSVAIKHRFLTNLYPLVVRE